MALDNLSLPIDIPWERLCVSEDMIDTNVCDREFPYRWRSSVSVFGYEPPEEYQEYEGQTISYLKVVCTVTGFQPNPEEVGLTERRVDSYWNDPAVIENYKEIVSDYYACYGAVLEVAVAPIGDDIDTNDYPYFVDYQPKKRELYEIVSETGEMMSRSLANVNVRKGTTSTDTHEVLDIFGGGGGSASAQGPTGGGSGSLDVTGQWGTRDITEEEYTNVRTTDRAREARELYSHTTQLTQMYHQLNSYHLGTNRAVFFMLPRPHIVQSEETFVNGPRKLEGVQEFFLVVSRPEDQEEFCTEAYLETAHIASVPNFEDDRDVDTVSLRVEAPTPPMRDNFFTDEFSEEFFAEDTEIYTPPPGWEVDIERNGGARIESSTGERIISQEIREVTREHVIIFGRVSSQYHDQIFLDPYWEEGYLNLEVTVFIRKQDPEISNYNQTLWLTGRGVCCGCQSPFRPDVTVTWEHGMENGPDSVTIGADSRISVVESNVLRDAVGRMMMRSRQDAGRYPIGEMKFQDTQFLSRIVAGIVQKNGHPDNQRIRDIEGVEDSIQERVVKLAPQATRGWLLEAPLEELEDRLELKKAEAIELRRGLLGLESPPPDPKDRWEPPLPSSDTEVTVPDVVGLKLEEARDRIEEADLVIDEVSYQDSEKPSETVINQYPNADEVAEKRSKIDIVVATGLSVVIPDVVGSPLSEAIKALREAGLKTEPKIQYAQSDDHPESSVIEITPDERSKVTPHTGVVLQVASGDDNENKQM